MIVLRSSAADSRIETNKGWMLFSEDHKTKTHIEWYKHIIRTGITGPVILRKRGGDLEITSLGQGIDLIPPRRVQPGEEAASEFRMHEK